MGCYSNGDQEKVLGTYAVSAPCNQLALPQGLIGAVTVVNIT